MFTLLLINVASVTQQCKTFGGPDPSQKCIFPFKWDEKTYYGCPIDPNDSSKTWCSTKVDQEGNHIVGQKKYGFCNEACTNYREVTTSDGKAVRTLRGHI